MTEPVVITDNQGHERVRIGEIVETASPSVAKKGAQQPTTPFVTAEWWGIRLKNAAGLDVIEIGRAGSRSGVPVASKGGAAAEPPETTLAVGGGGLAGHLLLRNETGTYDVFEVKLHPGGGLPGTWACKARVGTLAFPGSITVTDGVRRIELDAHPQKLEFFNDDKSRARLDATKADLVLGGNGSDGDVMLFDKAVDNASTAQAGVHIRGNQPAVAMNVAGQPRARLDGVNANLWLGGNGADANIVLFDKAGDNSTLGKASILLNGADGDIVLQNADCAEEFDIADLSEVEPGTVMVIEQDGRLRPSAKPYDRRVAGVISGAGEWRPAITLGRSEHAAGRRPVALVGRVFCKADANETSIEVGDLLTTAALAGHAMKATDPERAFGSVLGKALGPLRSATGLIPILVTLQ